MTDAPDNPLWLDAEGRICVSIACRTCEYDLRTLPADGRCPECGAAVGDSLPPLRLALCDVAWLRRVRSAIVFTLTGLMLVVPLSVLAVWIGPLALVALSAAPYTGGVLWLATMKSPGPRRATVSRQRTALICQPLSLVVLLLTSGGIGVGGAVVALGASMVMQGVAATALLSMAAMLLKAAGEKHLGRCARIGAPLPILAPALLALFVVLGPALAAPIVVIAFFAIVVCLMGLLAAVAQRISEAIAEAERNA